MQSPVMTQEKNVCSLKPQQTKYSYDAGWWVREVTLIQKCLQWS